MHKKIIWLLAGLLVSGGFFITPARSQNPVVPDTEVMQTRWVFYKVDQGFVFGRLLDMKMSNLHYTGPGFVLNFGRRAHNPYYISEWNFVRATFGILKPAHKGTEVQNPSIGFRYLYLRHFKPLGVFNFSAGLQANVFADIRMAPRLGNSYLFADATGELRPQADLSTSFDFFRTWNLDLSLSATLLGYGMRFPEYGAIYRIAKDGGVSLHQGESTFLHPLNFAHATTGIFFRESFGGKNNLNWFRIGYIWDFFSMSGKHQLNVNKASHQLVLELYFIVN